MPSLFSPFPLLFGIRLVSVMEGVGSPQRARPKHSPHSQSQGSSFWCGRVFAVQHCFQKDPLEMQPCCLGTAMHEQLGPLHRAGHQMTDGWVMGQF